MNNKGVTLIELLIVIVVIGIISAFAVPAVGNFLDSAKKQAVYQDAVAVRNAAAWYCNQSGNTCADGEELLYSDVSAYLDGFDASLYLTGASNVIATYASATNSWDIDLEYDQATVETDGGYEWVSPTDPINGSSSDVTADTDVT